MSERVPEKRFRGLGLEETNLEGRVIEVYHQKELIAIIYPEKKVLHTFKKDGTKIVRR